MMMHVMNIRSSFARLLPQRTETCQLSPLTYTLQVVLWHHHSRDSWRFHPE